MSSHRHSVNINLRANTEEIQQEIISKYQEVFSSHSEDGGIPKRHLRNHIVDQSRLSGRCVVAILDRADEDRNGRITLEEFTMQLGREDSVTLHRLAGISRFLNKTVRFVDPRRPQMERSAVDQAFYHYWGENTTDIENFVQVYTLRPPPIFIPLISIIQICFYIYGVTVTPSNSISYPVPPNSTLVFRPDRKTEVWRYVTYMFLHGNISHLIFNLIFQLSLGMCLELVHKWARVGTIYITGVIAGSLLHAIFVGNGLIGASGGCYALIGAHIANVLINWKEMQLNWTISFKNFLCSAVFRLAFFTVAGVLDLTFTLIQDNSSGQKDLVSISSHIGGFLSGLLIGVHVLKNLVVKDWEKVLFLITLVLYAIMLTIIIVLNIVGYKVRCSNY